MLVQNVSLGRFGVALFFLISGFIVPFSIGGERPLFQFAVSRVFRLYPPCGFARGARDDGVVGRRAAARDDGACQHDDGADAVRPPWLSPIYWTLIHRAGVLHPGALLFSVGKLARSACCRSGLALVVATALPVQLRTHGIANVPVQYLMHTLCSCSWACCCAWLVGECPVRARRRWRWCLHRLPRAVGRGVLAGARRQFHHGGLTPVLTAYALAFVMFMAAVRYDRPFAVAVPDRTDQLFDVSAPLAGERHGLPRPFDRTDKRYRHHADLHRPRLDGILAGLPAGRRRMIMFGRAIVRHGVASRP